MMIVQLIIPLPGVVCGGYLLYNVLILPLFDLLDATVLSTFPPIYLLVYCSFAFIMH